MPVKSEKPRPQEKTNSTGFRKVNFGAIAKQKPDSRTTYPILPDPQGRYAAIAARILERSVQVEALAGALEVDKADLKTLATPFYFTNASGKLDVPSSIGVTCSTGEVLITFQNRYGKLESEAPLLRGGQITPTPRSARLTAHDGRPDISRSPALLANSRTGQTAPQPV